MDLASEILQAVGVEQVENFAYANAVSGVQAGANDVPGQDPIPGALSEADARVIEFELNSALHGGLIAPGYISGLSVSVDRTNNVIESGELLMEVDMTPLAYFDKVKSKISFVSRKNA